MRKIKVFVASLAGLGASAYAAVPEAVTTELATVKTDIGSVGGLLIGLAVAVLGVTWIKAMFF